MRALTGVLVVGFAALTACQPKDVKIDRPNRFSNNNQTSFKAQALAEGVSSEAMFQYALTRLHQVISITNLVSNSSSDCVRKTTLREDNKNKIVSIAYSRCEQESGSNVSITVGRAVHELMLTRKDENQIFSLSNLQTMTLTTKVPMEVTVNLSSSGKSSRSGNANLSESTYFEMTEVSPNFYWFILSVDNENINEALYASKWNSRTINGKQTVDIRGWLSFNSQKKSLDTLYLQELNLLDERPRELTGKSSGGSRGKSQAAEQKEEFKQVMKVNLIYNEPSSSEYSALGFSIDSESCWSLVGKGLLKKEAYGFVNYVDKIGSDKSKSQVVEFSVDNKALKLGSSSVHWPYCSNGKFVRPFGIYYSSILIK